MDLDTQVLKLTGGPAQIEPFKRFNIKEKEM